jgi:hypothetical protein
VTETKAVFVPNTADRVNNDIVEANRALARVKKNVASSYRQGGLPIAPERTAKSLFLQLQMLNSLQFPDGQLRW